MTYRDVIEPPPCPVCELVGTRNIHLAEQLGPWECTVCWTYFTGTHTEWEKYEPHRKARRRLKAEAEERAAKETATDGT